MTTSATVPTALTAPAALADLSALSLRWHDVLAWGVEGKGWSDTEHPFDRLPARAKGVVRDVVWNLSRQSAGLSVRFETDAPLLAARWTLRADPGVKPHLAPVAIKGLDLYAEDGQGRWRWLGIGRPTGFPTTEEKLAEDFAPARRIYQVYLPLFAMVESLAIGVPEGAHFQGIAPRAAKPIVFYGTSITHGACASRPGMTHVAILGRRLDRPVLNLGFSGNGQMEPEVARLLADLDPCAFVVDCLPNMSAALVEERAAPLVRVLRAARPETPIVLVEDRTFANAAFRPAALEQHAARRAALRRAYERVRESGVAGLHYVEGEALIGDDGEGTVDGSHPTDLGFMRQAAVLEPVLRPLV